MPIKHSLMKRFIALYFLAMFGIVRAQSDFFFHIQTTCGNQEVLLQTNINGLNGQVLNVDHFNYYIADIVLYHDGGIATSVSPSIFIFTPDIQGHYLGNYGIQQLDSLQFMVGVPTRFNTQEGLEAQDISGYPLTHPLSFQSPSMYWGWQFGYMHMIVGGSADSNNDQEVDAYFELHNLGNHNQKIVHMPIQSTQTSGNQQDIYLDCRLDQWLRNIPLETVGVLHGENGFNGSVMTNVNQFTVFTQSPSAGLSVFSPSKFHVYENTLIIENIEAERLEVYDLMGRKVKAMELFDATGNVPLSLSEGIYIFILYGANHTAIAMKKCRVSQL